jgi:hypothetical protein
MITLSEIYCSFTNNTVIILLVSTDIGKAQTDAGVREGAVV